MLVNCCSCCCCCSSSYDFVNVNVTALCTWYSITLMVYRYDHRLYTCTVYIVHVVTLPTYVHGTPLYTVHGTPLKILLCKYKYIVSRYINDKAFCCYIYEIVMLFQVSLIQEWTFTRGHALKSISSLVPLALHFCGDSIREVTNRELFTGLGRVKQVICYLISVACAPNQRSFIQFYTN